MSITPLGLRELLRELEALREEVARLRGTPEVNHGRDRMTETVSELLRSNEELRAQLAQTRLAEEQLRLLGTVVENSTDGIAILTPAVEQSGPRIAFVNEAFSRITGWSRQQALAQTSEILRFEDDESALFDEFLKSLFEGKAFQAEGLTRRRGGAQFTVELSAVPVRGDDQHVSHWILFVRDGSDRRIDTLALERRAQYDSLTQLPNRVLLFDRLEQAVLVRDRTEAVVALLMMDLDRFKAVNDSFGHHAGDLLLRQVAHRLGRVARRSDTIARLGGDEFAILLPEISGARAAEELAHRILQIFETPFLLAEQSLTISGSIGIAVCPDHGQDASSLLRCADIAMYRAKQNHAGFQFYSPDHEQNTARRLALETDLRQAISGGELILHYQPMINLVSRKVTHVEALVRWLHPHEGLLPPDSFLPLAENAGLMRSLTVRVFQDALTQLEQWGDTGIQLTLNLSPSSLQDESMPETIAEILEQRGIDPSRLQIEITENAIMSDPGKAMVILSLLRTLGVSISLDDFGTGYSSLANLRDVPFDEIKIDRSFVTEMNAREGDSAIVHATIDLAHKLGRRVVAEGVEDERTLRTLTSLGCDAAQGFFISRPLPPEQFNEWLGRWNDSGH